MSRASFDTLRAKTAGVEVPAIYPVRGSAKAWANINQTGTQAVLSSLNTASIVDLANGKTQINFTSPFSDSNFSPSAFSRRDSNTDTATNVISANVDATKSTSLFSFKNNFIDGGATGVFDSVSASLHFMGDLA